MIKKIIVVPRDRAIELIGQIPNKERICVISISTPFGNALNFNEFLDDHLFTDEEIREYDFENQVLHLEFDDIDHNPQGYYMPMHFREAVAAWQFASHWHKNYLQDEEITMIVHCDAGISRSGAIGKAIAEKWDIPLTSIRRLTPNRHVTEMMEVGFRYLTEGLSPKQQQAADMAKMVDIFINKKESD